jgi:NADH-quinone oxidoreductase subunit G
MGVIDNSTVKIEIDGIKFNAKRGTKIIEVADEVGIYIPRFCYHKKLSIAANCRMCLVEVEKAPKLFPACATPVSDGMKIFTSTEKVIEAQRAVMEFLLINHPLDCPICDQGGECELQDLTVGYGCSSSRFTEKKRSFNDYDLGPLISTDVTRCILCSRCVRFCSEIAGTDELGIVNRGSDSRIFTFLKSHLSSDLSGNVIDLCPVGALTAKPSKFKARPWELTQSSFISCHDCLGSNLYVHVAKDKIIRIVPKRNELLNETWISDRDRFSYEGLYNNDRIDTPLYKNNNKWEIISWDKAFDLIYEKILKIKNNYKANSIATLASPNSTVEEFFLLQKFIRLLGSNNIDHRLKQIDFSNQNNDPDFIGIDTGIDNIDNMDTVFIIGSNITKEQPIIGLKLRKIINKKGRIYVLNPFDFDFSMNLTKKYITNPKNNIYILLSIIKNIVEIKNLGSDYDYLIKNLSTDYIEYKNLSENILKSQNKLILLGSYTLHSPDYYAISSLCILISNLTGAKLGILTDGCNTSGAYLSGFLPHRLPGGHTLNKNIGLNIQQMFDFDIKSYIFFGLELDKDIDLNQKIISALKKSEFNLSFSSFKSDSLLEFSDIILPISNSYENIGTFINVSGVQQSFYPAIPSKYEVKYGWKAIIDLAKKFNFSGFQYDNITSVLEEFNAINKNIKLKWKYTDSNVINTNIKDDIIYIPQFLPYDNDSLVRRAKSLQKLKSNKIDDNIIFKCNLKTFNKINNTKNIDNDKNFEFKNLKCTFLLDESISENIVIIENHSGINYNLFQPYEKFFLNRK